MGAPLLAVDDVSVSFAGLAALESVSMSVADREVVSLIGPNGAGKTTLFNVVCGFVRPTAGSVSFRGARLDRHHPTRLARMGIARTLQGVNLWPGLTAVENVMAGAQSSLRAGLVASLLGLPRSSREERRLRGRSLAVLDRLGVADAADRLPAVLPYGVQKRVAVARAIVLEPDLLLLDEPASGLSETEMGELSDLIAELRQSMAVLLVEHHMDFVMQISDRIVVLNFGRVIATGDPGAIRSDPAVTEAYLGEDVDRAGSEAPAGAAGAGEDPGPTTGPGRT